MSTPDPSIAAPPSNEADLLEKVRTGQKFVLYAILLNFVSAGLRAAGLGPVGLLVGLAAFVLSLTGLFRMASGLQIPIWARILAAIGLLVPLLNLALLLILSARATRRLREAGYTVGLMGAEPRS